MDEAIRIAEVELVLEGRSARSVSRKNQKRGCWLGCNSGLLQIMIAPNNPKFYFLVCSNHISSLKEYGWIVYGQDH